MWWVGDLIGMHSLTWVICLEDMDDGSIEITIASPREHDCEIKYEAVHHMISHVHLALLGTLHPSPGTAGCSHLEGSSASFI